MPGRPWCHRCLPEKVECLGPDCAAWVSIMGSNPNTGEEGLKHGCSDAWKPILMVEQSRVTRGTAAAIESFRNAVTKAIGGIMLIGEMKKAMLDAKEQGKLEQKVDDLAKGMQDIELVECGKLGGEEIVDAEVIE